MSTYLVNIDRRRMRRDLEALARKHAGNAALVAEVAAILELLSTDPFAAHARARAIVDVRGSIHPAFRLPERN